MSDTSKREELIDGLMEVLIEMTSYTNRNIDEITADPSQVTYGDWAERLISVFEQAHTPTECLDCGRTDGGCDRVVEPQGEPTDDPWPTDEAWDRTLDDYREGGWEGDDPADWERMFWEAGFRQGVAALRAAYETRTWEN